MRLTLCPQFFLLPISLVLLASACQPETRQPAEPPATPATGTASAPAAPDSVGVAAVVVSFDDYFQKATGQELSVATLVQQGARIISRKPTINPHDETQLDTVFEVVHGTNRFSLYRTPNKELLTGGQLTDFAPNYARALKKRVQVARKQAKPDCCPNGLRIYDAEEGMGSMLVTFAADSVVRVKLEPYWD